MSVLEFISSLKWPIVVLVLIATVWRAFKKHPGAGRWFADYLESRDLRGKAGPVEFEAMTKAAVEQAAAITAASDEELAAIAGPAEQALFDEEPSRPDPTVLRREVVEGLMRTSARWGWEMAQMGFRTPPNPHIEWSEDGHPSIMFGSGTALEQMLAARPPTHLTPAEIARRAAEAPQPELSTESRQAAIRRRLEDFRREQEDR